MVEIKDFYLFETTLKTIKNYSILNYASPLEMHMPRGVCAIPGGKLHYLAGNRQTPHVFQ